MLKLFNIESGVLLPTDEVLMVEPFKTIWKKDKARNKHNAINSFKYIEFMCSPSLANPYKDLEEDEKEKSIIKEIFKGDFKPTILEKQAIELYTHWLYDNSFSYKFLQATIKGAQELINFFDSVDLNDRTKSGNAIYKPADLTRALKDVEEIIKNLTNLEKRVFDEITQSKIKGNKDINPLEK